MRRLLRTLVSCYKTSFAPIALIAVMLAFPLMAVAAPLQTYLALGDSIAFGETDITPVSFGDQGYVRRYADWLATQNSCRRPIVINLAIPGETSTSFFTAVSPPGFAPHSTLASFNLNYQTNTAQSQHNLMLSSIASEQTAGHVISHVSFALGVNDLQGFFALHPDFLSLPRSQQQQLIAAFAAMLATNYEAVLTEIRAALPTAELLLLTYYNPNAIFGPADPLNQASMLFLNVHTSLLQRLAGPFGAQIVDIATPFQGHEAQYTFIRSGGVHPNDLGYAVIAQQMIAVSSVSPAAFTAQLELTRGPAARMDSFDLRGTFTLGAASNGMNAVTEPVTMQMGTFCTTIPAGSFTQHKHGQVTFDGTLNAVALQVRLSPSGGKSFTVQAEGNGADLTGIVNPVSMGLIIGNDTGSTIVTAEFQ